MFNVNAKSTVLPDVNYLVVGLGLSGYSSARFLLRHGYRCRVQDTRDLPPYLSACEMNSMGSSLSPGPCTAK